MIFQTIQELKSILGGAIDAEDAIRKSMAPFFDIAFENHLSQWLGRSTFDALVTAHAADSKSAAQTALLPHVQKVLGWLAYVEYSGYNDVNFGPAGRYRREDESRKGLFKYQENKLDDKALRNGYEAIEQLVLFLEANKSDHDYWEDEPGHALHHGILLHSAEACRSAHSKRIGRYVFEILRGKVEEVEAFTLRHLLGDATYEALLTSRQTGVWTNAPLEKKIIQYANRATLHFALYEGLRENLVQFNGNSVVQTEALENQSLKKQGVASATLTDEKLNHHREFANRHLDRLRDVLETHKEETVLSDFKAHQAALAQKVEEEKAALDAEAGNGNLINPERNKPWEVLPWVGVERGKGAVRL